MYVQQTSHRIKWLNISEICDVIYECCGFHQKRLISAQFLLTSLKMLEIAHIQLFPAQLIRDIKYEVPENKIHSDCC